MSPMARRARIIRLDNVKAERLGWQSLEMMITAPILSGRQMYVGEAWRRNTMTWTLTGNHPAVTTDIAQRTVFIHLGRPTYGAGWEKHVFGYAKQFRNEIWQEVAHFFNRPIDENYQASRRWAECGREILSRVGPAPEILARVRERGTAYDSEGRDTEQMVSVIEGDLSICGSPADCFVPTGAILKWCHEN